MTDRDKHVRKVVKTLLQKDEGECLMEFLKGSVGYDLPVFAAEDGFDDTAAKLRDGGRQLIYKLTLLQNEGRRIED